MTTATMFSCSAAPSPISTLRQASNPGHRARPTGSEFIAQNLMELPEDQAEEVMKPSTAEQDEDVQHVFHCLA